MRRDWELVRAILLEVESAGPEEIVDETAFDGLDPWSVAEHVRLLKEAELVEDVPRRMAGTFGITRLTWRGHDFLEALRPEGAMRAIREAQHRADASLSSETILAIGVAWASRLDG